MEIIKDIFVNLCIMFTVLLVCQDILYRVEKKYEGDRLKPIRIGLITGIFGCILVGFRVAFTKDIFIDLRNVLMILATLKGGAIAVSITSILLVLFRLFAFEYCYVVGVGAVTMGVSGIICVLMSQVQMRNTTKWYVLYGMTALSTLSGLVWLIEYRVLHIETLTNFVLFNSIGIIMSGCIYKYLAKARETYTSLATAVIRDDLTNLYNRRYYNEQLEEMMQQMSEMSPLSLIVFDIDHFKKVNDTYGHEAGDEVLKQLSTRVKKYITAEYILSRIGGEEFSIIMPHTDQKRAFELAEKIRRKVEKKPFKLLDNRAIHMTISMGVSNVPQSVALPSELFKAADWALYESKNNGRNKVTVYRPHSREDKMEEME